MPTVTARLRPDTHGTLKGLAEQTGEAIPDLLAKAVEAYRRQYFLEGLAADFAALRRSLEAWEEELAERELWDATMADDLSERRPR